jgi:ubiquinone/menaquinone biosynthesis C-methylase UbiE
MEHEKIVCNMKCVDIITKTLELLNKEFSNEHVMSEELINNSLRILKDSTSSLKQTLSVTKRQLSKKEKRTNNPEKCYYCITNNKNNKQCNKCGESKSCEECFRVCVECSVYKPIQSYRYLQTYDKQNKKNNHISCEVTNKGITMEKEVKHCKYCARSCNFCKKTSCKPMHKVPKNNSSKDKFGNPLNRYGRYNCNECAVKHWLVQSK